MGMGTWVVIIISLFVLGSIMALKPNAVDVRLDKLRMSARRLELNPKVVSCPEWIRGINDEIGAGIIAQYALILDDIKLPELHYQITDGDLVLTECINQASKNQASQKYYSFKFSESLQSEPSFIKSLENEIANLPNTIKPHVKGLYTKANCIVIFWHDSNYVKPNTNPNFDMNDIEDDLKALKSYMTIAANKLVSN